MFNTYIYIYIITFFFQTNIESCILFQGPIIKNQNEIYVFYYNIIDIMYFTGYIYTVSFGTTFFCCFTFCTGVYYLSNFWLDVMHSIRTTDRCTFEMTCIYSCSL